MKFLRVMLLAGAALFLSLFATTRPAESRDDYWKGYWGWYDGSYRPYYYRHHHHDGDDDDDDGYRHHRRYYYAPQPYYGYPAYRYDPYVAPRRGGVYYYQWR